MIPHLQTTRDIPHSPPFDGRFARGPVVKAAIIQARLNEIARHDPTAVLSVLEFWLGPKSTGDDDALDS